MRLFLALTLALIGATGCATRTAPAIISPAAAAAELNRTGTVLLDIRAADAFAQSHVAGARQHETKRFYAASDAKWKSKGDPEDPQRLLAELGITPTSRVLLYDRGGSGGAAVGWFTLQSLGVTNASVIDGGYPALAAALPPDSLTNGGGSGAVPPTDPTIRTTAIATAAVTAPSVIPIATKADVLANITARRDILIDARSAAEFTGTDIFDGNTRGGRIPGSINLPHKQVFSESGAFVTSEELRAKLADLGVTPQDRIILYCQGGGRSAILATAMHHAGFTNLPNYVGSFGEWNQDPTCPVEAESPAPSTTAPPKP